MDEKPILDKCRVHVNLTGFTKDFELPLLFNPFDPTLEDRKELQDLRREIMRVFEYKINLLKAKHRNELANYRWLMDHGRF